MNHDLLNLTDKISLIGELEHLRRHAIRSAKVAKEEDKLKYEVMALQAQKARRKYQKKFLDCDEKDWCLVKTAATLKQLAYETCMEVGDIEEIEDLADSVLTNAFGVDLSGCESCVADKMV